MVTPLTRRARVRRRSVAALAASVLAGSVLAVAPGPAEVAHAATLQVIPLESVQNTHVTLGTLASRSQRKPVTIAGIGPYTVTGTDSITGQPYSFVTDFNYAPSTVAYQRESDERAVNGSLTVSSQTNITHAGRTGVTQLKSNGNCLGNNNFNGMETYCSVYGPQVYSQPFQASLGQSVSFDWAALRVSDDYEIYAYLVKVTETTPGTYNYGTASSHQLLAHGRGDTQGWTTASGAVPSNGTYRFRFVNGSFDKTGGFAIGSEMYIDSVVKVGLSNPITFPALGDKVLGTGSVMLAATAVSPTGTMTYTSLTSSVCTVSGNVVTLKAVGTCSIVANHPGDNTDYVPAESVTRSFKVLAEPTKPTNSGVPLIQGTVAAGSVVSATEGTWGDGGSPITGTVMQWNLGGAPIAGLTGQSCVLVAQPGASLTVTVTKTNAIGSTSATSAALTGYTCVAATAPAWTDSALGTLRVGVAATDGVAASGSPTPSYIVVDGTLPAGLALNGISGAITGTPTAAGAYDVTIRASNGIGSPITLRLLGTVLTAYVAPQWSDQTIGHLQQNEPFADAVTATGDPAPTYSVSTGTLPDGLELNGTTGAITGTPTVSGPYDVTIRASNGIGSPVTVRLQGTIELADAAPEWTDAELADTFQANEAYSDAVAASGYPVPTYAITVGELPEGLTLNETTGAIFGAPLHDGPYDFTVTADNGIGDPISIRLQGEIEQADAPLEWNDNTITDTFQDAEPYSDGVRAVGYPAPRYSVTEGALPAGIVLDEATGAITGTPTADGSYEFTVTATNSLGSISVAFVGEVEQADASPVWTDDEIGHLQAGEAFIDGVAATGYPAVTFTVTAGELPDGLELDESTGAITGTPTADGPFQFTITASNGIGDPVSVMFSGDIEHANVAPVWTDDEFGHVQVGEPFADGVAAAGYPAPVYAITAGALPAGLVLDEATGVITGTPTTVAAFEFTVTASNGIGEPVSVTFTGDIEQANAKPVWTDQELGHLQAGMPVNAGVSAVGHPALTYTVSAGQLPAGLTLDPATGAITGTPTGAGPYEFTITASNGIGQPVSVTFTGVVEQANAKPVWTDRTLAAFTTGARYTDGVSAAAYPAAVYAVSDGKLPAGLTLNPTTGAITGTPSTAAAYAFTIRASNAHGSISERFTGTVAAPVVGPVLDAVAPSNGNGPVQVSGAGLEPGTPVEVTLNGTVIATGVVSDDGTVTIAVTLPNGAAAGAYPLELNGTKAGGEPMTVPSRIVVDWSGTSVIMPVHNGYQPLTPHRVLDTRFSAKLPAGGVQRLAVADDWNVPASATSLVLNVTATETEAPGYLTVYPCGSERPLASALNYVESDTVPNLVVVPIGSASEVCIFTLAAAQVVVDLNGYFGTEAPDRLAAVSPMRLLDTREGVKIGRGEVYELQVTGADLAPVGAGAAVLNATVTQPEAAGYLTMYPCDQARPTASNVNYRPGDTVANQAFVKLSATGTVCIFSLATTNVVIDLNAAFHPDETPELVSFSPVRVLDTRNTAKLAPGQTIEIVLGGADGISGATAFPLNVTVTQPEAAGFITLYPCGRARPTASNVNYNADQTIANHTTAVVGENGSVCLYSLAAAHVVIDVEGAYL